jgi:hypothetical protein
MNTLRDKLINDRRRLFLHVLKMGRGKVLKRV